MGRKKKERTGAYDRIGEEVNLEKCPVCDEHPDCFAWMDGKCTALKESGGQGCVFYVPAEAALAEAKDCYKSLRERGRSDLIRKYIKALTALGMLDDEIEAADQVRERLEAFREFNYQELLEEKEKPGSDNAAGREANDTEGGGDTVGNDGTEI